jgi:membrane protein
MDIQEAPRAYQTRGQEALKRLWQKIREQLERVRKFFRWLYRIPYLHGILSTIGRTGRGFYQDDCHIMAAAISFYAILSLIPFLLLLLSFAGYLLRHFEQDFSSQKELFTHLVTYVQAVVPFLSEDVMDRLRGMVSNRQAYGITGIVVLLITAGLVFRTLELAFARVFKTMRRRSMLVSQLFFVAFLLALGLLFLLVHYLGVISSTFATAREVNLGARLQDVLSASPFLRISVTTLIATLVFVVLLKYFTKERVRIQYAFYGGLLFSILWMLAIRAFAYYLSHIARFSLLYGSLATLAIIVVWIFYSSIILLLCAEFTCVLQARKYGLPVNSADESPPVR